MLKISSSCLGIHSVVCEILIELLTVVLLFLLDMGEGIAQSGAGEFKDAIKYFKNP